MGTQVRTITDAFLLEQMTSNPQFQKLFEYIEKDEKACFEHRLNNEPVLYYDSKKMLVFEVMTRGGQRIRVSFPKNYLNSASDDQFELESVLDWGKIIKRYSEVQSKHIRNTQNSYLEDRWQFELVRFFNYVNPGADDYFVINTEYGQSGDKPVSYIDLVLLHGLKTSCPHIVLCELKYGDGSLRNHGINDHLTQYQGYLDDEEKLNRLVSDMTEVFKQRCTLGLIKGVPTQYYSNLYIKPEDTTAMIVVREHNPSSKRLNNEMELVRNNMSISEIKKRTKIIIYNEGDYNSNNPFNENYCLDDFK